MDRIAVNAVLDKHPLYAFGFPDIQVERVFGAVEVGRGYRYGSVGDGETLQTVPPVIKPSICETPVPTVAPWLIFLATRSPSMVSPSARLRLG